MDGDKKVIIKEDKLLQKKQQLKKKLTTELLEQIAKVQGVKRRVVK